MTDDRWLVAWALGSVALGGASLLVPLYVVSLGGGAVALGALAAAAALGAVPGALVVGRLADRTGRRRAYVVGALTLVAVMLAAMPLVEALWLVVIANAVVWLAAAAAGPVLTLLATADVPEQAWPTRFGVLNRYQGWGWVGGLVLGVAWTAAGDRLGASAFTQATFFLTCGACSGAAAVASARWLPPDPETERSPQRVARALRRARRFNVRGGTFPVWPARTYWAARSLNPRRLRSRFTPALSLYFVGVVLAFTGFAAFFAPLPLYLRASAGFSDDAVFAVYLASSLGSAVFYVTAGRLAGDGDVVLLQAGSLGIRGVVFPVVAVVGTATAGSLFGLGAVAAAFVVLGVTWAVIAVTATTLVTQLAPAGSRGEVLGVYGALSGLAGVVGSAVGGVAAGWGFRVAFGLAGGLVLAGAAVVVTVHRLSAEPTAGVTA